MYIAKRLHRRLKSQIIMARIWRYGQNFLCVVQASHTCLYVDAKKKVRKSMEQPKQLGSLS